MAQLNEAKMMSEIVNYMKEKLPIQPEVGLVLGSGLGVLAERMEQPTRIAYEDIPHFPVSTVAGHAGEWVAGYVSGRPVLLMNGRFHMYEGYSAQTVALPIRVMRALGIEKLIVTNAAGGINTSYNPGDLMLIEDHINFTSASALIGPNNESLGPRFPDMSTAYNKAFRDLAEEIAEAQGISLKKGVYIGLLGPTYETPAEIRMMRGFGADAVGMSTVNEVIAARHVGIEVLGISCISNMAAGILPQPLTHDEVIETANKVKEQFLALITGIIPKL